MSKRKLPILNALLDLYMFFIAITWGLFILVVVVMPIKRLRRGIVII